MDAKNVWKNKKLIGIIIFLILFASFVVNILDINIFGSAETGIGVSNNDKIEKSSSPRIIAHPLSQTVTFGKSVMFYVIATGTGPLSYQWQKNGLDIPNEKSSSIKIPSVTMSDDQSSYSVIITNNLGSVISDKAILKVRIPLKTILDDFDTSSLNTTLWDIIDPVGDSTFTMVNTGTSNASLRIMIPSGISHDVWGEGNFAPRIMQKLSDSDFEMEAKFQSQMSLKYQMQGMIVQQDNENFIRFDIFRDATSTRIFAASFSRGKPTIIYDNAIPPENSIYLRINRNRDDWSEFYSFDGLNWTEAARFKFPLIVSSAGLFAGNAGDNPSFTCQIDYSLISVFPEMPVTEKINRFNISGFKLNAIDRKGIENWNITLKNSTMQRKMVTGINGFYEFKDLVNGSYTISEEMRPGYKNITPLSREITISGQNISDLNFINRILQKKSEIVSDDFSDSSLNTSIWTLIDPQKDSSLNFVSDGTSNSLSIKIPSGISHDVWIGNNAPRIMQSVNDTDFEVEIKFNSLINKKYQMQGIIIQQDINNFIRFDFFSDDKHIYIFAVDFKDGSPSVKINKKIADIPTRAIPLYLRVQRAGNKWDQLYSLDGTNWYSSGSFDRVLIMNLIGPFVGNAGNNPEFNGIIDYFKSTSSFMN